MNCFYLFICENLFLFTLGTISYITQKDVHKPESIEGFEGENGTSLPMKKNTFDHVREQWFFPNL